jgi:hypothetical protein
MEETTVTAEGIATLYIRNDRDGGVLDRLGIGAHEPLDAVVCPECGLTQLYAPVSE